MADFKHNILATLAYYDVLDMPLRAEEVWLRLVNFKHLEDSGSRVQGSEGSQNTPYPKVGLDVVYKELHQLVLDGTANRSGEYYFLFGREYLVPLRLKHEEIAKRKWQKAKRAIQWLRFVPYVRAVFGSGSLAINNTDELSDLDVLVVVKHGRIWLARLWITVLLSVLGVRRRGSDKIAPDKICLNHYISDQSLLIPFQSIYNAQTYSNLIPIYVRSKNLIEQFKNANRWVLDFVFSWNLPDKPLIKNGWLEKITGLAETVLDSKIGNIFEKWARNYQYNRIVQNPATRQPAGRVIITDEQLEFHPHSIETSIIKKYNDNLIKLGITELAIEHDSGLNH